MNRRLILTRRKFAKYVTSLNKNQEIQQRGNSSVLNTILRGCYLMFKTNEQTISRQPSPS